MLSCLLRSSLQRNFREIGAKLGANQKMAPTKFSEILQVLALCITGLSSVMLQLHGLMQIVNIFMFKNRQLLLTTMARRQNCRLRKLKLLKQRSLLRKKRGKWVHLGRTDLWWQNIRHGVLPESCWRKNFRMSRNDFYTLLDEIEPYLSPDSSSPNYRALSACTKLAITLYYLKDKGSLAMTANSFGIAVCTASKVITQVCKTICKQIGPKYIHMPRTHKDMREKIAQFESKFGAKQSFGCIDGTHIPILCPVENSQDYFKYKNFYSINVQAVCDYRGYFLDVECTWPGSVHDAKVFANSSVNKKMRNGAIPMVYQTMQGIKIPCYLIGDPAYPLTPFCMKEYKTCSNNLQVVYNSMLCSARNPIECAFGRLKARWGILTRTMDLKLETVPIVVYCCFVLHNFCEKHDSYINEELLNAQIKFLESNEAAHRNTPDPIYSIDEGQGDVVRRKPTNYIEICISK